MRAEDRSGHRRRRISPREALKAYKDSGGVAFYFIANNNDAIGVRNGNVSAIGFNDYHEIAHLGQLAGSRAELLNGPQGPVAIITFPDGARYFSSAILADTVRDAQDEVAEYNRLAGYRPGPVGYVPAARPPARQDPPGVVWSCKFCKTTNKDRTRCDHCGAPRPELTGRGPLRSLRLARQLTYRLDCPPRPSGQAAQAPWPCTSLHSQAAPLATQNAQRLGPSRAAK
jgi:hypothetical protein